MKAEAYFLEEPEQELVWRALDLEPLDAGDVLLEVLACGLCHTDLSYASGSVEPRHGLPLVLGHEIVGRVVDAGGRCGHLAGKTVLVPAVLPCGSCELCQAGRGNACTRQKMPGNDIHGGFATHVVVPGASLVDLSQAPADLRLDEVSVVADAVSTAYQAICRAEVRAGDAVFVVGAGGVGGFLIQIARALGARVAACDVSRERLDDAVAVGAEHAVDVGGRDERDVRKELRGVAKDWRIPSLRHRIFECSGTGRGQSLAYSLLGPAATMVQVGYTIEKITLRLSNVMAFDATIHGSWGCPPEAYPAVMQLLYDGQVKLGPFVEHAPMSRLNELLDDMASHRLSKRMVLHPDPDTLPH